MCRHHHVARRGSAEPCERYLTLWGTAASVTSERGTTSGLSGIPRLGERLQSTGSQEAIFVWVVAMQAVPQSPQHGHEQRHFGVVDGVAHVQKHRHATAIAKAPLLLRILRYLELPNQRMKPQGTEAAHFNVLLERGGGRTRIILANVRAEVYPQTYSDGSTIMTIGAPTLY